MTGAAMTGAGDGRDRHAVRVVVADDQLADREGLVALLGLVDGIEVVGEAGDGEQALELVRRVPCDVVLMDLRMPLLDGVAATRRIVRDHPETSPDGLTAREAEVVGLIGHGLSTTEIAERLVIGQATVKTHINNAFAKIRARTRADAVRYAYRMDLA
jgi:DNA-binding NarL/FixJ family response regulator